MLFFYKVGDFIKRIFIVAIILTLSFQNVFYVKADSSEISHEQMVEMYGEGYSKTLFGAMLEANAKMSVNEAENREALDGWINNSRDYIKGRLDKYEEIQGAGASAIPNLLKEMGIGLLTLGETGLDFFKNLFGKIEDIPNLEIIEGCEYPNGLETFISTRYENYWTVTPQCGFAISSGMSLTSDAKTLILEQRIAGSEYVYLDYFVFAPTSVYALDNLLRTHFNEYVTYKGEPIQNYALKAEVINKVVNHIPQKIRMPILKPQATCAEGQKVIVPDGKGGFVDGEGNPTDVSACTVTWLAPTIDRDPEGNLQAGYDDEREKIVVEETVIENECDGVLCFLGKIVGAITDLATSIADIATSILDGLIGIFVPEDLDFVTEGFNNLTDSLTEKISIVEDLKNMVKSIFVESDTNPLKDITLDLPILDKPLQFGNVPFIETGVPILKRVISAIVLIYTVLYLYRKITGRGGVMEK